ncbi:M23 family metallopeptidase [Calidifontibacillus oryziterrae]|uniref:M23 family metallopeptidase n=1 Tax=Calidifontibacillus oryziterrae TaxID=1191699 RepID=UPI0002E7C752|nr:M23 family metallopeptidase [Calidifontibacillus oryziterrae]
MKRSIIFMLLISFLLSIIPILPQSIPKANIDKIAIYSERMALYKKVEALTHIPWFYLAAIDQYERNIRHARRDLPNEEGLIGIYFSPRQWVGPLNPNLDDKNANSIKIFGGIGLDGNGDQKADRNNDEDILFTFANYISTYGFDKNHIKIALWDYYQRDKTVGIIMNIASLYEKYGLNIEKNSFPIPLRRNYSYKNTWGDRRGWGGVRIHEGTDIFASYGTPVRSTTFGVIELKGWNKYGGWRIGIRDINNVYHYYAHLSGFEGKLKPGQIVEAGQVIGYVGSSGYGPPGTSGKFPPHLHYGMYKDNGISEWSFDPYPSLRLWERKERKMKK